MKILFVALHRGYYRNLDSVVEELARRGHQIHLGFERGDSAFGGQIIAERLTGDYANVTSGPTPSREEDWLSLATKVRLSFDYLRFLEPVYNGSSGLRPRAELKTPIGVVRLSKMPLLSARPVRRAMGWWLDAIDRALPASPGIDAYLESQRPDLVVVTPLIGLGSSSQLDLLRSAQARGIRTAAFVWSWDHLSSKGIIRDCPDSLFVWNSAQKREATEMHRVPADRVVVTGAQCYDRWFDRKPFRGRSEFAAHAGLRDERPYVLWVCSALLPGSPPEPEIVMRWAMHLRRSANPRIRALPIMIRPHPSRLDEWTSVNWTQIGNVAFCGRSPIDEDSRSEYFDSLYHSTAVVGITTSAFIEAAIVGRPVMTVFSEDLRQEHEGSLHFQHLLTVGGGVMNAARTLEEHELQLSTMLDEVPASVAERGRRFVEAFVRPHGLARPATPIAADALERVVAVPPRRLSGGVLGRLGLRALAALERKSRWHHLFLDVRELEVVARQQAKERVRDTSMEFKRQQHAEKARRRQLRDEAAAARLAEKQRAREKALKLKRRQQDEEKARPA